MSAVLPRTRFARLRAFTVVWTIACIVAGVLTTVQTMRLDRGADAIDGAARGLSSTADSLRDIEDLPFVGKQIGEAANSVDRGADSTRASSEEVRGSIQLLAILLGLAVAILPTVPLIVVTVALRS